MSRRRVAGLVAAAVIAGTTGCTAVVAGSGTAAPPSAQTTVAPGAATPSGPATPSGESGLPDETGPAGPPRAGLAADVLDDECLLDAIAFSSLLAQPVLPPEQVEVPRGDGSSSSCVADSARGSPEPLAAVNVYEPRSGTPAEFVRAGPPQGRRELLGVGGAAVLVDTAPGVTLQLAAPRHVVTIAVLDGAPSDDAWRAAAATVLAGLPG